MSEFWFSGIKSQRELKLLKQAFAGESELPDILINSRDYHKVFLQYEQQWSGAINLDSDAYYNFKRQLDGSSVESLRRYVQFAFSHPFARRVSADVIGNPMQALCNWDRIKTLGQFMPVWDWDSDRTLLKRYLEESEVFSDGTVGIGGLMPVFRQEDKKARDKEIKKLEALCLEFPGKFHIFGACLVQVINKCGPYVRSLDSSIWLDGKRYEELQFINSRTGKLSQAPVKIVDSYFGCGEWDGERISIENARNIHAYMIQISKQENLV